MLFLTAGELFILLTIRHVQILPNITVFVPHSELSDYKIFYVNHIRVFISHCSIRNTIIALFGLKGVGNKILCG